MQHHFFKAIANHKDFRYLLLDSAFISERKTEGLPVLLFQMGSRYVELVFDYRGAEVVGSREFTDTNELEPYLNQIPVLQLFS